MSEQQLGLFSGEVLKQEGIEQVTGNNEEYIDEFYRVGVEVLRTHGSITSEDVVSIIGMPEGHVNAVGAAMRAMATKLQLSRVGYRKATRPSCHARYIAIWK